MSGGANLDMVAAVVRFLGQKANIERAMDFTARVGELIQEYKREGLNLKQTAEPG